MNLSLIYSTYNRTPLMKFSLESITKQIPDTKLELNVIDEGSLDGLKGFLNEQKSRGLSTHLYSSLALREKYKIKFNCPAAFYNSLVQVSTGDIIIKSDPEFVFVTDGFFENALFLLREHNPNYFILPLPHHMKDHQFVSLSDIKHNYKQYEYSTHITSETASRNNVYYGCVFSRTSFIELGGVDVRFSEGIGSEDDHFLDQWRRKYGQDSVITLTDYHGVHLWHGGFSGGVPPALNRWVESNATLRKHLSAIYPNNGNFYCYDFETEEVFLG